MKYNRTIAHLLLGAFAAFSLAVPSTAQMFFEKRVSDEPAILENPPNTVMAKVVTTNAVPPSLQNAKYDSDVEVTKVVDIAYAKGDKSTAFGSLVRITGKAFVAVYGSINISPGGSVDTGSQRIEKVGQPPTRLEISGLKQELYYAGKLWKATTGKEKSYIFVTESGITGVNVSIKDSPLKSKCLREDTKQQPVTIRN